RNCSTRSKTFASSSTSQIFTTIEKTISKFSYITFMNAENNYLNILKHVLQYGYLKPNRTGVSAYTVPHQMLQHDMANGFPLLTTKKMGIKSIAAELEFFIKGLTDKKWLKD